MAPIFSTPVISSLRSPHILLGAICLWLSLDFLLIGKSIYISTGDNGDVILSGLLANKSLGLGRTYWNVFSAAGVDRLGQGFYGWIDEVLFTQLPGWAAYQIRIVSQIAAAAVGTFVLCRTRLRLSHMASCVGGFVYANVTMSGLLVDSVNSYLPFSILAIGFTLDRLRSPKRWLCLIAVVGLISLTAYLSRLQPSIAFTHFLWFAVVERRRRVRDWCVICGFSFITIAARFTDYWAAISYGTLSHRVAAQIHVMPNLSDTLFPQEVLAFRVLAIIMFAIGGCLWIFRRQNPGAPFVAYLAGSAIVAMSVTIQPWAASVVPLIGSFALGRLVTFLWIFVATGVAVLVQMLSGLMPSSLSQLRWISPPAFVITLLFLVSLQSKYIAVYDWVSQGSYVLQFESEQIKSLAAIANKGPVPYRIAVFQMYPTMFHPYGLETIGGYQALTSKRYSEFWEQLIRNSPDTFRSDRLMLSPERHLPEWEWSAEYDEELLSYANVKYVVSRDRLSSVNLRPIAKAQSAWSSLSTLDKIKQNVADNFRGRSNLFIYENILVAPRFQFAQTVTTYRDDDSLLRALGAGSIETLRKTLLISDRDVPSGLDTDRRYGDGSIEILKYSPDEIHLRTNTEDEAILLVSNGYSPYWRVSVNGIATIIFPAQHAFWGLRVPKGSADITFRYDPPWRLGR